MRQSRRRRSQEGFLFQGWGVVVGSGVVSHARTTRVTRMHTQKDISGGLVYGTAQSFMKCAERMRVLQLSRQHGN